jgi:pilus assembly protein CpaD
MTPATKEIRAMRNIAKTSLIALGLLLSGCSADTVNRSVDSVHQPVVQRVDYVLDVNTAGEGLANGEAARIRGWFESLRLAYGDRIAVDTGESGNARFAVGAVAAVVGSYGLTLAPVAPTTQGALAPGAIRVVVSRTTASVPGCPTYKDDVLDKFNSPASPNYGCATNASLAAMIANPEDLIQGRSGGNSGGRAVSNNAVNGTAINGYYNATGTHAGQIKAGSAGGK